MSILKQIFAGVGFWEKNRVENLPKPDVVQKRRKHTARTVFIVIICIYYTKTALFLYTVFKGKNTYICHSSFKIYFFLARSSVIRFWQHRKNIFLVRIAEHAQGPIIAHIFFRFALPHTLAPWSIASIYRTITYKG